MKLSNLSCAVLVALGVAACGGRGGDETSITPCNPRQTRHRRQMREMRQIMILPWLIRRKPMWLMTKTCSSKAR